MHDIFLSFLLGIIEGLTEFLPVSSTAHLRIAQLMMHIDLNDEFWKMYAIVIQLGAILCLPIYFRDRILKFVRTFPRGERGDRTVLTHPLTLVCIAFVVTAIPSYLLAKKIGEHLENMYVIGTALFVGGILMWAIDHWFGWRSDVDDAPHKDEAKAAVASLAGNVNPTSPPVGVRGTPRMEDMSLGQAIWIGAVQILSAVFPGTSRSMSTIAAGQLSGMSRSAALEFSFFLSMPTMIVATGYSFLKAVGLKKGIGEGAAPIEMDAHRWIVLAIGFIVSFFVAWAVVAWFMSWVRRRGFAAFGAYRIFLGAGVLVWAYMGLK